jgi:hypothetical protein
MKQGPIQNPLEKVFVINELNPLNSSTGPNSLERFFAMLSHNGENLKNPLNSKINSKKPLRGLMIQEIDSLNSGTLSKRSNSMP